MAATSGGSPQRDNWPHPRPRSAVEPGVGRAATEIEENIRKLDKETSALETQYNEAVRRLANLQARAQLSRQIGDVTDLIAGLKWVHRASQLVGRFAGILRSLSRATTDASTEIINSQFRQVFEEERTLLRAPEVEVAFPGTGGKAARKKQIVKRKPSEILSEGEQRVIALADFLAEVRVRAPKGPVVFDDPVTSLDYRRLDQVADRLAALAKTHQVIVFTHDIMLVAELLERFSSSAERSRCTFYAVTREDAPGYVTSGRHPRWDTAGTLRSKIDEQIRAAEQSSGEDREKAIRDAYSLIRSWLEVVVERDLFKCVTERYRPQVTLGSLASIKIAELEAARTVILRIFKRCCRVTPAHSQAGHHSFAFPALEDLKEDWDAALEMRAAHK